MNTQYTNCVSDLDCLGQPTVSDLWSDIVSGAESILNQGVSRVDETNKNIKTTNETVKQLYADYQVIKPLAITFGIILTAYLITGTLVNYREIKKHGRK